MKITTQPKKRFTCIDLHGEKKNDGHYLKKVLDDEAMNLH